MECPSVEVYPARHMIRLDYILLVIEVTVSSKHQRAYSVILSITDDVNFYLFVETPLLFSGSPLEISDCSTCN